VASWGFEAASFMGPDIAAVVEGRYDRCPVDFCVAWQALKSAKRSQPGGLS